MGESRFRTGARLPRLDRTQERDAELPVPFCCPLAGIRTVRAAILPGLASPAWFVAFQTEAPGSGVRPSYSLHPASHCPFCGASLPALRRKPFPPPSVQSRLDIPQNGTCLGGPRCGTCGSRWEACLCSFPESCWEADDAPPVGAAVALVTSLRDGKEHWLSVSRKDDHEKKGLPGGKVEPGESPVEAVVRELREETKIEVGECHLVLDILDEAGTRAQFFHVTSYTGVPSSGERGLVEWLPPGDLVHKSPFGRSNLALLRRVDPLSYLVAR